MLTSEGRLPLSIAEHDAVEALIAQNPAASISLTRRYPGETGPVLVHVNDKTFEVDETGGVTEVTS